MKKIYFKYDYYLTESEKWNQVLKLVVDRWWQVQELYWSKVILFLKFQGVFFPRKERAEMRKLKIFTDELFSKTENNAK